jgi:DNA-binding response OmpR family regulator
VSWASNGAGGGGVRTCKVYQWSSLRKTSSLCRNVVEEALAEGGYETATATTGEEAVNLLKADNTRYHALVTDIHLGGTLDGWDVAREAREIKANLPVVYMTGAAADEWASKGVPNSILLRKPFAPVLLNDAPPNTSAE